jgi:uncharacterized protein YbaP (TraB family)
MRHRLIGLTLAGLALLLQPAPAAVARGTKLFAWKATSPTTEVYLLGSIHLGKKEWYPLAKEIDGAFDKSKVLVLEADPGKADQLKIQQLVLQHGVYMGDDSARQARAGGDPEGRAGPRRFAGHSRRDARQDEAVVRRDDACR